MAFDNITQLTLGNVIQIAFTNGVHNQMSLSYKDQEMVKRALVDSSGAREIRFYFQNGLLPSNVQWRNPGQSNRAFPRAFQPATAEYTAKLKEVNASVELEYNLYERAKATPEKYAQPLEMIVNSAVTSTKREIARAFWKDGTGVIGQIGAAAAALTSPVSNQLLFTLNQGDASRGHVGDFEHQEIYILRTAAGAATALDTSLATEPAYWKVMNKNRLAGTVLLQGLDSSFNPVANITSISVQPESGSVFYKYDQPTIPDLTSISNYSDATEMLVGLESLAANDGRLVHGITMSGITGATEIDCGANPIDLSYVNSGMDQVKIEVGPDQYSWKVMCCAPEVQSALIESREDDRRFTSKEDARSGSKVFGFQHRRDFIELSDSEYVHPKRLWILPEQRSGDKVLEYHGSDFKAVKAPGGDDFRLKVDGGAYVNTMVSFMQAWGVLICHRPKAIVKLRNFTA